MYRRLAISLLTVALLLAAVAPVPAAAADTAPLPTSMAAVGDSITQAASTGGSLGADYPQNSWSTGTSSTVNSHFMRLRALSPNLVAHNRSVSGAKVADLPGQMQTVAALSPDPGYLTVLIGGNDVCTDTVGGMTSVTEFRAQFTAAMQAVTQGSPSTYVYVVSIPDVYQLWNLFKGNWWARFVWSAGNICQSLLANPTSTQQTDVQRRAQVRQRNIDFNAVLKEVCESPAFAARCRFDNNASFNTKFTASDVSADYFHPSIAGQAKLASVSWAAGYTWASAPPPNQAPAASFSASCSDLACSFTDTSTDADGTIATRSWSFGDGASSTLANPSHTYAGDGAYTVTLTVIDDDGATGSTSRTVSVTETTQPPPNADPVAAFTPSCTDLTCAFDASASSDDGGIVSYGWSFGDGTQGSGQTATHAYVGGGTYSVTLTVTDGQGATDAVTQSVTVSEPPTSAVALSVRPYKVKGVQKADLTWSGATTASVLVYRDNVLVTTTANDGAATDDINRKGGGSYTYRLCETGGGACSAEVSVSY